MTSYARPPRIAASRAAVRRGGELGTGWEFRRWQDGTVLSAQDLTAKSARLYGEHTYTVHRADLLDAVKRSAPTASTR